MTDVSLNSIAQSFATGSVLGERRAEPVRKHVLPDGALYSGQVRRDLSKQNRDELVPDGRGKIKWPNGDKYSGRFMAGRPHGEGVKVMTVPEGTTTIEGIFHNGFACGPGKMNQDNAQGEMEFAYEGDFLADKPEGFGTEIRPDGTRYEGYFRKGKKGPKGKMQFGDGNVYHGDFENGQLHGHGRLVNETKKMSYDGEW